MSTDSSNVDTGAEVDGTEADKINTGALGTMVTVGVFAMLTITAAVTALVRHDLEIEEAGKDADANQVVAELKASQRDTLNGPAGYVDRGKGVVSLPIDLAKSLVVAELARDPSSATPPAPPKPDASAAPAAAAGGSAGATGKAPTEGAPSADKGREVQKPAPGSSTKPSPVPSPTPTAATPGAESPGPTNK